MVVFVNCQHKGSHADPIVLRTAQFFSSVVHCVELADLVRISNLLEQSLDGVSVSGKLEVVFSDAQFCESCRE